MNMLQIILWLVYPYAVVAILGMGLIWKANPPVYQEEQESVKKYHIFLNRTTIGLMFLSFGSGIVILLFNGIANESAMLYQWVLSLINLDPNMELIRSISFLSRTHFLLLLTFLLLLPFSKYICYLWPPSFMTKVKWSRDIN